MDSLPVVDLSVRFDGRFPDLPPTRQIEDPAAYPISPSNPLLRTVQREPYVADEGVVEAVNLAIALGRPLLVQGEPGSGKTCLAHAVAYELGLPLEVCNVKSTTAARDLLYTYDAVSRLYHAQLGAAGPLEEGSNRRKFDRAANYVRLGPLGRAIVRAQYGRRSVVLIDNLDRADLDLPNDLLDELERLEFGVPEAEDEGMRFGPPQSIKARPIVIVTNTEDESLPPAFLRRCIYHYINFPENEETLWAMLRAHGVNNEPLSKAAAAVVRTLREPGLTKNPALGELIDWVIYLQAEQFLPAQLEHLPALDTLLKDVDDQLQARLRFHVPAPSSLPPAATGGTPATPATDGGERDGKASEL